MTVQRHVVDISNDAETQFSKIFNKCVYCSQTAEESTAITLTAQKCIFARGVTSDFEAFEELVDLLSTQGQTKGSDFSQALLCSLQKQNLELPKLVCTVTDGVSSTAGSKMVWCLFFTCICTSYNSRMN
jgi:hypothetical protein